MTIYKDLKIGSSVNGTSQRYTYNITSSVSSVSGADANGNTLAYDSGFADVYLNGVRLSGADITITSGNSVSFASNLSNGDVVDIVAYGAFTVASVNADNLTSGTVPDARITGTYTGLTGLDLTDNSKIRLGTGNDLEIYHDGSSSIISDVGTGRLIIRSDGDGVDINKGTSENIAKFRSDAGVELYYDNSKKFETTSAGATVTGTTSTSGGFFNTVNNSLLIIGGGNAGNVGSNLTMYGGADGSAGIFRFRNATTVTANVTATGQIQGVSQSPSTPTFAFTNDTNTGMTRPTTDTLTLVTAGSERMRINSTGLVGIGTSAPATTLHVSSGTANTVSLIESTDAYAWLSIKDNSSANSYINSIGASGDNLQIISKDITFRTSSAPNVSTGTYGTERMRIDSSGNFMVGKTSTTLNTDGVSLLSNGNGSFTRDNATPLNVNRRSSNGDMVDFYYNGASRGTIEMYGGATLGISLRTNSQTGPSGIRGAQSSIIPYYEGADRNNELDLGSSSTKWKDLYLGGGLYVGGTGTANKLDDYEEGTWTPSVTFGGGNTGVSSGASSGSYTKVGRMVYASALLLLSNKGSSTGNAKITGLPFSMGAGNSMNGAVSFAVIERISFNGVLTGTVATSNTTISLLETASGNNTAQNITNSDFNNSTALRFNVTYQTA